MTGSTGFLVWNPAHGMPTFVHQTFLGAVAEADRLKRAHPGSRFVVMAPVEDMSGVGYALGWSRGREQAHRDVMDADARADRARDELFDLQAHTRLLNVFSENAEEFQAIVADCLLWFDGFAAAQSGRDTCERSHLPHRDKLTTLNAALQSVLRAQRSADLEAEIPF
ncbi:hypothetical protein [Phenylobacterium sp. 58.2.17]|uniref:hypothetical protein n=1 Tax=Phenylobacterium sp. 58.2.17 TaxID=2969306 RepID=UPI002264C79A|nr:hypothetical protein [Phenylobacterium sp. 58.2.17]MCX7585050.1 hypothetical protein [Phenylobacterium sp. 58.2.17]